MTTLTWTGLHCVIFHISVLPKFTSVGINTEMVNDRYNYRVIPHTFVLTSQSCLYAGFILEDLSGTILVLCIIVIATPVQIRKMATAVAILQALAATAESKLTFDFF